MTDQVTSVEQSKRLIEMGVPAEKASMGYGLHVAVNTIYPSYHTIKPHQSTSKAGRVFPPSRSQTSRNYYPCSLTQKVHFTSISPNVTRDGM